jgi:hypothetical protein
MEMRSMQDAAAHAPLGDWAHSFEEDQGDLQIYRPVATFNLPPARRVRESLTFAAGGVLTYHVPGPDDRPRSVSASALGMNRFRLAAPGDPQGSVIEVVEISSDKLILRVLSNH